VKASDVNTHHYRDPDGSNRLEAWMEIVLNAADRQEGIILNTEHVKDDIINTVYHQLEGDAIGLPVDNESYEMRVRIIDPNTLRFHVSL
jgi:hypothetical protein